MVELGPHQIGIIFIGIEYAVCLQFRIQMIRHLRMHIRIWIQLIAQHVWSCQTILESEKKYTLVKLHILKYYYYYNLMSLLSLDKLLTAAGALFLPFVRPLLVLAGILWLSELGLLGGESFICDWDMAANAPGGSGGGGVTCWDLLDRLGMGLLELLIPMMGPIKLEPLLLLPRFDRSDLSFDCDWDLKNFR